jgi:hypothetical protein
MFSIVGRSKGPTPADAVACADVAALLTNQQAVPAVVQRAITEGGRATNTNVQTAAQQLQAATVNQDAPEYDRAVSNMAAACHNMGI